MEGVENNANINQIGINEKLGRQCAICRNNLFSITALEDRWYKIDYSPRFDRLMRYRDRYVQIDYS